MSENKNSIILKVSESFQEDINKGVLRIDQNSIKKLNLNPQGDFVEIKGNRKTVAIAGPGSKQDEKLGLVRMDGILRRNSQSSIGEVVEISKAEVIEAKKVSIAPTQKNIVMQVSGDAIKHVFLGRPVIKGDVIVSGGRRTRKDYRTDSPFGDIFDLLGEDVFEQTFFGFSEMKFVVTNTNPKGAVLITENTELEVESVAKEVVEETIPDVSYEDIGGLEEEIKKVREMVELPLKHPEIFERMGIEAPKGVLLYGPPGTGKTLLAKAVANETNANFKVVNGPEIMSKFYGESEKHLREVFEDAEKNAPSIIFLDEIDAIAPKREEVSGEVERRVVAQLNSLMDGLKSRGKVIVIAATNIPNAIDPALRRPGRFDRELELRVPSAVARKEILNIHTRNMPLGKDVNLEEVVDRTHGYVGADLAAVSKEAAMIVLRRVLPDLLKTEEVIPKETLEKLVVTQKDLLDSLRVVRPSAMREVFVENPNIPFDKVGGLENVKKKLKQSVEWPMKFPHLYEEVGIRVPKGILLYGPPGTGKTLMAKAVATETKANFILVNGPELLSKWVGESEKAVRKVFEKARQVSPAIVFFDEIDSLVPSRGGRFDSNVTERMVNQFLSEMDGLKQLQDVIVIAATNRPDLIDSALLRPGRFDRVINIPSPDRDARLEILKVHTSEMKLEKNVDLEEIANRTEGYVGADMEAVCIEAGIKMLEEDIKNRTVSMKHFKQALEEVGPSVTAEIENGYREFEKQFKKKRGKEVEDEMKRAYLG